MTTLQQDAEKFAAFIVANYPDAKHWEDPVAQAGWYIAHAFVAVVSDGNGEIVALLAARPVERPGLGVLPYYFNEHGTNLHVDLWCDISQDDRARIILKTFALLRWPLCTTIAMFRHYEGKMNVYSLANFWRSFEKIKKIRRKRTHETVTVAD